jgi:hypothetical protein
MRASRVVRDVGVSVGANLTTLPFPVSNQQLSRFHRLSVKHPSDFSHANWL